MSRSVRTYHRIAREVHGEPPWLCAYCDGLITGIGIGPNDGIVHHDDNDSRNNHPDNLKMMHQSCHTHYHMTGRSKTREHADKVNAANRGQKRSDEAKERMRQRQLERVTCQFCDYTSSKSAVRRHENGPIHSI